MLDATERIMQSAVSLTINRSSGSQQELAPSAERTQAELAYNELSHRILILEIAPNDRIVEQFWAKKLQVNRSAVRESLTRLFGEGLVYQGERGGFFVSEMTDAEIHEKTELYFDAGAKEVWICAASGTMSFLSHPTKSPLSKSGLCPEFPKKVKLG